MQSRCTPIPALRLSLLGIDPNTADMSYPLGKLSLIPFRHWEESVTEENDITPAWSLAALIEFLPREIVRLNVCFLSIDRESIAYLGDDNQLFVMQSKDIFQNAVDMIEWLIRHNYLKVK